MAAFPVPRYLAETAAHEPGVRDWITELPGIVASLAGQWSLRVGEPFQPGGQCSWTAPATDASGTASVLKVGFQFPGGEERDEAAGLRTWDGNGTVRLHAACSGESGYGLLMERCVPGTPLGRVLPEPEQDVVVAELLRRLWAQPPGAYPFRALAEMCAAWAARSRPATPPPASPPDRCRAGQRRDRAVPLAARDRRPAFCCAPTCTPRTS